MPRAEVTKADVRYLVHHWNELVGLVHYPSRLLAFELLRAMLEVFARGKGKHIQSYERGGPWVKMVEDRVVDQAKDYYREKTTRQKCQWIAELFPTPVVLEERDGPSKAEQERLKGNYMPSPRRRHLENEN